MLKGWNRNVRTTRARRSAWMTILTVSPRPPPFGLGLALAMLSSLSRRAMLMSCLFGRTWFVGKDDGRVNIGSLSRAQRCLRQNGRFRGVSVGNSLDDHKGLGERE